MEFQKNRRLLSYARRAIDEYEMIKDNDKIAVGISGGKDSIALFCTLVALKRFYPVNFELVAVTIDMGFEGMDFSGKVDQQSDIAGMSSNPFLMKSCSTDGDSTYRQAFASRCYPVP